VVVRLMESTQNAEGSLIPSCKLNSAHTAHTGSHRRAVLII
jgi:hypothetical protein